MKNRMIKVGNVVPSLKVANISYNTEQIKQAILQDSSVLNTLGWKKGMTSWQPLSSFLEFSNISQFGSVPPPIPSI